MFTSLDRSCRGFLTLDDFLNAAQPLLPSMIPGMAERAFIAADKDKDGRVSYGDFVAFMQSREV